MDREVAERFERLEKGQEHLTEALNHLTGRIDMLTVQVASLTTLVSAVESQVGRLVATMLRGFTAAAERDGVIEQRLDQLEALVAKFEGSR